MHGQILKLVFKNPAYVAIIVSIVAPLLAVLLNVQQYLFFEPYLVLHVPSDRVFNFTLLVIVSVLIALVLTVATYQIRLLRSINRHTGGGVASSFVGAGAGVCVSCGSIGISIISALGVTGAMTLSLIEHYAIPIRVASIAILGLTYFVMIRNIGKKCRIVETENAE
ncbi:MAG: hypothetical protein WAO91_05255 [Candidatus Nitrosotenuis sp.]